MGQGERKWVGERKRGGEEGGGVEGGREEDSGPHTSCGFSLLRSYKQRFDVL